MLPYIQIIDRNTGGDKQGTKLPKHTYFRVQVMGLSSLTVAMDFINKKQRGF